MRARIVVPWLLLVVAACTGTTNAPDGPIDPSIGDVVVLGTPGGSVVVDSGSGSVLVPDGGEIVSPDGTRLYSTFPSLGSTTVETRDSVSGELVARASVRGKVDVRVASITGHAIAMMRPLPEGIDPTIAIPRARTTIVVADPTGRKQPRRYRLTGNFEPEAFSVDDTRLFLIQYLPAEAPSSYRVTFLDLEAGTVHPVFGRFRTPPERMPGIRLAQVFDRVSEQLYTLYTNRAAAHFHDHWQDASYGEREVSFVHVLNLRDGWAYCAGLPRQLWGQPAGAQAMAASPDGRQLYVVDSMRGLVAQLDTRTMEIARTVRVSLGTLGAGRTTLAMSPDGHTLFAGSARDGAAVYAIDVETLEVRGRWPMPGSVTGLAISGDGVRLYVALGDGIAVRDAVTGRALTTLQVDGVESILHVATPTS